MLKTLALLVLSAALGRTPGMSGQTPSGSGTAPLDPLELTQNWERFNGSRVLVRGEVFAERAAGEYTLLLSPGRDQPFLCFGFARDTTARPSKPETELTNLLGPKGTGTAMVVVKGLFTGAAEGQRGHLLACRFVFTATEVLSFDKRSRR
ncbi:MAG: hypothetical protein ABL982_24910 [Vicinamibacterales bacterium]